MLHHSITNIYRLSNLLNSSLNKRNNMVIDSHIPCFHTVLQLILKLFASYSNSLYIIHRMALNDHAPYPDTFLYMNTPKLYLRRIFRDEDILYAIRGIDQLPNIKILLVLNPFKYLDHRNHLNAQSFIEAIIEELNKIISREVLVIIYNEHNPSNRVSCNKFKYLRYTIVATISQNGMVYIAKSI